MPTHQYLRRILFTVALLCLVCPAQQKPKIPRVEYLGGDCEEHLLNADDSWDTNRPADMLCTAGVEDPETLRIYELHCAWGPAETSKWPRTPCAWPLPAKFNLVTTAKRTTYTSGDGKLGHVDCGAQKYGCFVLEGSIYLVIEPTRPWIGWGPAHKPQ
jgi:hypothetical protein